MVDYRRPIEFGVFPVPEAGSLDEVLDACREADRLGLDLIGIRIIPINAASSTRSPCSPGLPR